MWMSIDILLEDIMCIKLYEYMCRGGMCLCVNKKLKYKSLCLIKSGVNNQNCSIHCGYIYIKSAAFNQVNTIITMPSIP